MKEVTIYHIINTENNIQVAQTDDFIRADTYRKKWTNPRENHTLEIKKETFKLQCDLRKNPWKEFE